MYYDFYIYTEEFGDFDKAFEITKALVDSVDGEKLKGYNFNRYNIEGHDDAPHITVRLDLDDESETGKLVKKLSEMKNDGIIDDFSDNNPTVSPFRNHSINHHLAHEASTRCAFKFHCNKKENAQNFQEFSNDRVSFLSEFIPLWLKNSGYVYEGASNIPETSSTLIENLVRECGAIVRNISFDQVTNINVFSERLIHTFMNCLCISSGDELTVLTNLANQFGYSSLQEFINELTIE